MNAPLVHEAAAAAGRGSDIRITRVETIPLRVPLTSPVKIASGAARPFVELVIVRLHTSEGMVGIGETQAWRRQGSAETLSSLTRVIEDHFAPHIVGRSPFEIARIMKACDEASWHSYYAQAPVGDALFDLQGKILGVPVYQLLGGKYRSELGGCAVLYIKPTLEETLEGAADFHARGFRSFTVKVGLDLDADVANVRGIRERFGPDAIIRVDANAGMGFDGALKLLKRIKPFDIDAAEQLLPLHDVDGMAELARRVDIPIMTDECVANDHDLLHVIFRRAATVVQTKVAKNGGLWYSRKLWHIADAAGMRIYPGNHPCTSIATASVAHLAAAWPGPLLDGPFSAGICGALTEDIVTDPLEVRGHLVRVPDKPGLGVTLDEETIRRLRVKM